MYGNFDIILDDFSRMVDLFFTQRDAPLHPPTHTRRVICGAHAYRMSIDAWCAHTRLFPFSFLRQAYVTLFTLMVVNDWNNTMFGHVQTINTWVRAYFMLNYVFTVLIVVNVRQL